MYVVRLPEYPYNSPIKFDTPMESALMRSVHSPVPLTVVCENVRVRQYSQNFWSENTTANEIRNFLDDRFFTLTFSKSCQNSVELTVNLYTV